MKEKWIWPIGFAIGLFGFRGFFWGTSYDPQVFFNSAILLLNVLILLQVAHPSDKKSKGWVPWIVAIGIGVVFSYINKSLD